MVDVDPWGSDLEPEQTNTPTPLPAKGTRKNPQAHVTGIPPESFAQALGQPMSLRSICLGVVGLHLDELIECGGESVLACLPSDARVSLLAVARRKRWVDAKTLRMFLDETWPILDIAKTGLDAKAIEGVAEMLPNLQAIDLSDCILGKETLQVLGRHCPLVEIVRLRNVNLSVARCIESIALVIPCVHELGGDSWEDDPNDSACGRWMNLKYVVWPGIPSEVESFIYSVAPKLVVVGTMGVHTNRNLTQAANPSISLDQPYVELVGPKAWRGVDMDGNSASAEMNDEPTSGTGSPPATIAERFRMAYVELDTRKAAKIERNCKQRRRREMRRSKAHQVLARWLDEG